MDFMRRWKCQYVFLAPSYCIVHDRSNICFIFMKDFICFSFLPSKGSLINIKISRVIMQYILSVLVSNLLHVSMIGFFCSSLQVFLYAFSLLFTPKNHLVMLGSYLFRKSDCLSFNLLTPGFRKLVKHACTVCARNCLSV